MRALLLVAVLPVTLLAPPANGQAPHNATEVKPRQTDLPLSKPADSREPQWERSCHRDSLTGIVESCSLGQRGHLAVSTSLNPSGPIYNGGLFVNCAGEVSAITVGPGSTVMYPVRYVQAGVVLEANVPPVPSGSALGLFASPHDASWATGVFAFESKARNGRLSAVWRFVFDDSDREAVQAFLHGPDCR